MTTITRQQFLDRVSDIITASGTEVAVSNRGNGSLTLRTLDDHAAHAYEMVANRAGLKVLSTVTDNGLHVIGIRGF